MRQESSGSTRRLCFLTCFGKFCEYGKTRVGKEDPGATSQVAISVQISWGFSVDFGDKARAAERTDHEEVDRCRLKLNRGTLKVEIIKWGDN